jgi:hypothetical protein
LACGLRARISLLHRLAAFKDLPHWDSGAFSPPSRAQLLPLRAFGSGIRFFAILNPGLSLGFCRNRRRPKFAVCLAGFSRYGSKNRCQEKVG